MNLNKIILDKIVGITQVYTLDENKDFQNPEYFVDAARKMQPNKKD